MDVAPVTNEIDSDVEDLDAEESIMGRKQSSLGRANTRTRRQVWHAGV